MEPEKKKRRLAICFGEDMFSTPQCSYKNIFNLQNPNLVYEKYLVPIIYLRYFEDKHLKIPFYEEWVLKYIDYDFFNLFRMKKKTFELLLNKIRHIQRGKQYFGGNFPITLQKTLLITLMYLARGEVLCVVADRFGVAISTVYESVKIILKCLKELQCHFIQWPSNMDCRKISNDFKVIAGFPNVIGAIDGTHIKCKIPNAQQDSYQDRYFQHSISLQAVCLENLTFTNISAGYPGSLHDARILKESELQQIINKYGHHSLFYNDENHIIGDSAYPCKIWLLTPYRRQGNLDEEKINYNKKLSQTRVKIENAFGLLKNRWRILLTGINVYKLSKATDIVVACCVLHNFSIKHSDFYPIDEIITIQTNNTYQDDDNFGITKRDNICSILNRRDVN